MTVLTFEEAEYGGLAGFRIEAQWDNPDGTAVTQEQYITLIPGYVYVSILTFPSGISPQITQMLQDIHRSFSFK